MHAQLGPDAARHPARGPPPTRTYLQHGVVLEEADHGGCGEPHDLSAAAAPQRRHHGQQVVAGERRAVVVAPKVLPDGHCLCAHACTNAQRGGEKGRGEAMRVYAA